MGHCDSLGHKNIWLNEKMYWNFSLQRYDNNKSLAEVHKWIPIKPWGNGETLLL